MTTIELAAPPWAVAFIAIMVAGFLGGYIYGFAKRMEQRAWITIVTRLKARMTFIYNANNGSSGNPPNPEDVNQFIRDQITDINDELAKRRSL